jgi:RNA polymerase sigma-70 factor (ECF subfamily)
MEFRAEGGSVPPVSDRPKTETSQPTRSPEEDWSLLMAQAQQGDGPSYRRLLQSVTPYLRALAHRFGLGGADLEDAVQDVLLTVHSIRHTYDPTRPFAPWLTAVARHRLLDRLRRRVRQTGRETELTEAHETFAAVETNHPELAGEAARLQAAIAALPEGQRRAVEMLKLKEMSLKEAAQATGQSETALKVSVHRAIKRLRGLLGGN